MLKVGITGGIGSGKTTICKIFECLGIPVYYADERAKELMTENQQIIDQLTKIFGGEAYYKNGKLDRKHIAKIAFNDPSKLAMLNGIVHPEVFRDYEEWHKRQHNVSYTLKEAALLFESGGYRFTDRMITVFAAEEIRITRVMRRDRVSRASVKSRIKNQMPDEEKMNLSDFIIYNDQKKLLIPQVLDIHRSITNSKLPDL